MRELILLDTDLVGLGRGVFFDPFLVSNDGTLMEVLMAGDCIWYTKSAKQSYEEAGELTCSSLVSIKTPIKCWEGPRCLPNAGLLVFGLAVLATSFFMWSMILSCHRPLIWAICLRPLSECSTHKVRCARSSRYSYDAFRFSQLSIESRSLPASARSRSESSGRLFGHLVDSSPLAATQVKPSDSG